MDILEGQIRKAKTKKEKMNTNKNDMSALIEPGLNNLFLKHYKNYNQNQDYKKIPKLAM